MQESLTQNVPLLLGLGASLLVLFLPHVGRPSVCPKCGSGNVGNAIDHEGVMRRCGDCDEHFV